MLITDVILKHKIKFIGRTYVKDSKLFMNFSGSGIKFSILSNKLIIKLTGTRVDDINSRPYVSLIIDGNRKDYPISQENYIIDLKLPYGSHIVEVLKRTETSVSFCAITEIIADSFIDFVDEKELKIEFYGDSLTCGFGNLSLDKEDPFKTETESFLEGYSYLVAKGLNADYSAICVSGFPVYKSRWNEGFPIDSVADMISISDYSEDMRFDNVIPWDNKKYKPNLIMVNLGANDHSYFTEGMKWIDDLVAEYGDIKLVEKSENYLKEINNLKIRITKFLDDLCNLYGKDIKIVWCLFEIYFEDGILLDIIKNHVLNYEGNTYFYKISCVNNDRGAAWHPGKIMHKEASIQLIDFIKKEVLGGKDL